MERRFQDNTLAIVVGVGVLLGVTAFGAVIAMLLGRRFGQSINQPLGLLAQPAIGPLFPTQHQQQQQPIPVVQMANQQTAEMAQPSYTTTISLSTTIPSRVMNAGSNRHWAVQLRNIGPPGSIARVATDSTNLAYPTMSFAIPAGGVIDMRVRPGDALFAIGNVSRVQLSVIASEEAA